MWRVYSRPTLWCCYCTLLLKADQSADLTCWSLRNITQLTNAIRKLRRPITGSSAQCSHHCMSSLQLLTSWTRDVDHRADTGSGWTDHSKHDCRTRDRCKANSDNVLFCCLFEMFMCYVQGGVCAMVGRNLLWLGHTLVFTSVNSWAYDSDSFHYLYSVILLLWWLSGG